MRALIGYTGFVGSNILENTTFDCLYNSSNISEIDHKSFDLVVCAGVRAEKYLANMFPDKDLEAIEDLVKHLTTIKTKRFVLISTVDVYGSMLEVDENTEIDSSKLDDYGKNRLYLEKFISEKFNDYCIVRLPALFGKGLKKNFIYDCIRPVPKFLTEDKFNHLDMQSELSLEDFYVKDDKGFNLVSDIDDLVYDDLYKEFIRIGFTALHFTDSRNEYQFYSLANIWNDIEIALRNNLSVINLVTEPIKTSTIAREVFGVEHKNELDDSRVKKYSLKSIHHLLFDGKGGYISSRNNILQDLKDFKSSWG